MGCVAQTVTKAAQPATTNVWTKLATTPHQGKQDDIFFASDRIGWYGNGEGNLYRTDDGGEHWNLQWKQPGTFIRALGFVNNNVGVLGNVGTGYFPGVLDETPLYRTADGGQSWKGVRIDGPMPKGICAIDVYRKPYINHGTLAYRTTLRAGGRAGGPAYLLKSDDDGQTWKSRDMSRQTAMILDIKFVSDLIGFIAGATNADVEKSHGLILRSNDGGMTWKKVYESPRPWEITWKLSFPTEDVGYVSVQNYDPSEANSQRFVAKTTNGGIKWSELPVANDHALQEFGIGFTTPTHGWLGGQHQGFETNDGGRTWQPADVGDAVNKFRVVPGPSGTKVFAIGSAVTMIQLPDSSSRSH